MSLASAQKLVSAMKSDGEFRAAIAGLTTSVESGEFLQARGYDFELPELLQAMAACMDELESCGARQR
jgi:hypothetical protein